MTPPRVVSRRRMGLLAGLAAVLSLLGLLGWEVRDDAWLLSVGGRAMDVRGATVSLWTEAWRDCRPVRRMAEPVPGPQALQALDALRAFSPPDSRSARLLRADVWEPPATPASPTSAIKPAWVALQAEFDSLEPVVVLVRLTPQAGDAGVMAEVIPEGVWSSTTRPWHSAWRIRRFLSQRVPQAPKDLLDCLDPAPVFSQPPRPG